MKVKKIRCLSKAYSFYLKLEAFILLTNQEKVGWYRLIFVKYATPQIAQNKKHRVSSDNLEE